TLAVHHVMTTPTQAAVRLLGIDPFEAAAVVAGLGEEAAVVVAEALAAAPGPLRALPCRTGSLVDIAAVHHAASDGRLFAT
ncbi:MAG: urease accessory protein UreF, partial [Acidimicrobiales bacterium]